MDWNGPSPLTKRMTKNRQVAELCETEEPAVAETDVFVEGQEELAKDDHFAMRLPQRLPVGRM
jgi:hypothetical protein